MLNCFVVLYLMIVFVFVRRLLVFVSVGVVVFSCVITVCLFVLCVFLPFRDAPLFNVALLCFFVSLCWSF